MLYNTFDGFVNKILKENMRFPSALRGVGATSSNVPPSSDPQITSAQTLPQVNKPKTPQVSSMTPNSPDEDGDMKNEIEKLPTDIQQKIASAKNIEEINLAIANVDPTSKQKIQDYIKNYAASGQNTPAI